MSHRCCCSPFGRAGRDQYKDFDNKSIKLQPCHPSAPKCAHVPPVLAAAARNSRYPLGGLQHGIAVEMKRGRSRVRQPPNPAQHRRHRHNNARPCCLPSRLPIQAYD